MIDQFQYYGFDWAAMILTSFAIFKIGNKKQIGFVLMMSGNAIWIIVGFLAESNAMITANIIFFQ